MVKEYSIEVCGHGTQFTTVPQTLHQARLTLDKLTIAFPKTTHRIYVYEHVIATRKHVVMPELPAGVV